MIVVSGIGSLTPCCFLVQEHLTLSQGFAIGIIIVKNSLRTSSDIKGVED